jgi:hypothetical protein
MLKKNGINSRFTGSKNQGILSIIKRTERSDIHKSSILGSGLSGIGNTYELHRI